MADETLSFTLIAVGSALVGLLVFMVALEAGVPFWKHGWVLPGDACDMGVTAGLACFFLLLARDIRL